MPDCPTCVLQQAPFQRSPATSGGWVRSQDGQDAVVSPLQPRQSVAVSVLGSEYAEVGGTLRLQHGLQIACTPACILALGSTLPGALQVDWSDEMLTCRSTCKPLCRNSQPLHVHVCCCDRTLRSQRLRMSTKCSCRGHATSATSLLLAVGAPGSSQSGGRQTARTR